MPEELDQYFAFISYSHKDKRFAEALLHHLEHYRLPAVLCKKYPLLPKTLNPIFLDQGNLPPGVLVEHLHEALDASRFLIVICSPHSARPNEQNKRYVDEEVNYFYAANPAKRHKRIIPVIYRTDESYPVDACLPPALHELRLPSDEMPAIDVLKLGQERSFNNIIAGMLGIDNYALWERWRKEQKRRRRWRRIRNTFIILFLLLIALFVYAYHQHLDNYYEDYVIRNNIPYGINQIILKPKDRENYYHFIIYKGIPREVVYCDANGRPTRHSKPWLSHRPVGMKVEYDTNMRATRHTLMDIDGKPIAICEFAGMEYIDIYSAGDKAVGSLSLLPFSPMMQEAAESPNKVARLAVTRDEQGCIIKEMFYDAEQEPVADEHGIWGRSYERDKHGRELSMRYLNRQGEPTENMRGIAGYNLRYANERKSSPVTHICYLDSHGNPVANTQGWASAAIEWDEVGNLLHITYYAADGNRIQLADDASSRDGQ